MAGTIQRDGLGVWFVISFMIFGFNLIHLEVWSCRGRAASSSISRQLHYVVLIWILGKDWINAQRKWRNFFTWQTFRNHFGLQSSYESAKKSTTGLAGHWPVQSSAWTSKSGTQKTHDVADGWIRITRFEPSLMLRLYWPYTYVYILYIYSIVYLFCIHIHIFLHTYLFIFCHLHTHLNIHIYIVTFSHTHTRLYHIYSYYSHIYLYI